MLEGWSKMRVFQSGDGGRREDVIFRQLLHEQRPCASYLIGRPSAWGSGRRSDSGSSHLLTVTGSTSEIVA